MHRLCMVIVPSRVCQCTVIIAVVVHHYRTILILQMKTIAAVIFRALNAVILQAT